MDEFERISHQREEDARAAVYLIRYQQALQVILKTVQLEDISARAECVEKDKRIEINSETGVYACGTHGKIHICGLEPCNTTMPSGGSFVCFFSGRHVELRISRYGVLSKKDAGRDELLDGTLQWVSAPRQRKQAGTRNTLTSAPATIEGVLNDLFQNTKARSKAIENDKREEQRYPEDWIEPPLLQIHLAWLRKVCLAIWQVVEQHGSGVMLAPRCKKVVIYFLTRLNAGDVYKAHFLLVKSSEWLKTYVPDERRMRLMEKDITARVINAGKQDFSSAFFAMERKGLVSEFQDAIQKL